MVLAFGDGEIDHLKDWARGELHINLDTRAADSRVPRAENTIRFVKERLRSIQCETTFKKISKETNNRNDKMCHCTHQPIQENIRSAFSNVTQTKSFRKET